MALSRSSRAACCSSAACRAPAAPTLPVAVTRPLRSSPTPQGTGIVTSVPSDSPDDYTALMVWRWGRAAADGAISNAKSEAWAASAWQRLYLIVSRPSP
jgi:hypothetical protein